MNNQQVSKQAIVANHKAILDVFARRRDNEKSTANMKKELNTCITELSPAGVEFLMVHGCDVKALREKLAIVESTHDDYIQAKAAHKIVKLANRLGGFDKKNDIDTPTIYITKNAVTLGFTLSQMQLKATLTKEVELTSEMTKGLPFVRGDYTTGTADSQVGSTKEALYALGCAVYDKRANKNKNPLTTFNKENPIFKALCAYVGKPIAE